MTTEKKILYLTWVLVVIGVLTLALVASGWSFSKSKAEKEMLQILETNLNFEIQSNVNTLSNFLENLDSFRNGGTFPTGKLDYYYLQQYKDSVEGFDYRNEIGI